MNDDFLRKFMASTGAFNKAKSISDLAGALAPLSSVELAVQKSLSNLSYQNPVIDAISKSTLAFNAQYFEPVKFNPVMAAFGSVTQMMHQFNHQIPVNNIISTSVIDLMKDFSTKQNHTLSPFLGVSKFVSSMLTDTKFNTFNWRESYPDLFTEEFQLESLNEYSKFNKNLDKLIDLSIINEDSTLGDSIVVSVNLDNHNDIKTLDPITEEIFAIANQTIEEVSQKKHDYEVILYDFLKKIEKIIHNPYTVNLVTGIILIVINHYYEEFKKINETKTKIEQIAPTIEIIITEKPITVKQRADNKSKTIDLLPIGVEIEVNKRFKKWIKIIYTKNYIPQIGYCRNDELKG